MSYQKYQLKNNTNIFLVSQKDAKSATVLVMFPVGSRYEDKKMTGVSHFIEHMMFKGTKKRKDTLTLTREIDRLGAEYNAFTSKEYTGYYIKTDADYLETSLDILSDMLFNSVFDKKEMEKEKRVIVEEIKMYNDNPIMHIESLFEELMYTGPLGADTGGTAKTVLSYERNDVLSYRDEHYLSGNMTVVVAGKITNKTKNLVEKYFGSPRGPVGALRGQNKFEPAEFGETAKSKRIKVENKKTDQAQLMIGFPGFNHNDSLNSVVAVFNTIFGGSMSSRLFIEVREKRGLAYFVKSSAESFRDTGYFYVRAGLDAKNVNHCLEVIRKEINKVIKNGTTEKELKDAKTHLRGAIALSLEDSSAEANWYARQALFMDSIKTPEQKLKEIDKVTNHDIKKLAKKIFDWQQIRIAVIGNINSNNIKF